MSGAPDRILIVDDQEPNRRLLVQVLHRLGYDSIQTASSSAEGIRLVREWDPDIVLLDIHLGASSGLEFLEAVRGIVDDDDHLPILVVTVDSNVTVRRKALELGATDFLAKPIDLVEVGHRVRNFLHIRRLNQELVRQRISLQEQVMARTAELTEMNSALRATNERLELLTGELLRSNEELERFASIAAHDLQEPLRKIKSFGDRLLSTDENRLQETQLIYVQKMIDGATRMSALVEDLLEYARTGRGGRSIESVDLSEVVANVISDVDDQLAVSEVMVEIGALPKVAADPAQMHRLFQNLISNSIKFSRSGCQGWIRVAEMADSENGPQDDLLRVAVEDNGIGFDPAYAEKIFEPFERLHSRSDLPGTGVGLAICRSIAENSGGWISALGKPGEGATFTVALRPARQPQESVSRGNGGTE